MVSKKNYSHEPKAITTQASSAVFSQKEYDEAKDSKTPLACTYWFEHGENFNCERFGKYYTTRCSNVNDWGCCELLKRTRCTNVNIPGAQTTHAWTRFD